MDSKSHFVVRRWTEAFAFAIPIIFGAIMIGILGNILDHHTNLSTDTVGGILIILMVLLITFPIWLLLTKRELKGFLKWWRGRWDKIPTWRERMKKIE